MARTSNLLNLATVARTGVAYYPGGWNFQNGGTFGQVVEFAANTPRIANGRLLVEENTTNAIPNPRFVGATGSTPPTGWVVFGPDGLTIAYTRVTVLGSPALRVDVSGTAATSSSLSFTTSATTDVIVAPAQTWTGHLGFARFAGVFPVTPTIAFQERTAAGGFLSQTEQTLSTGFAPARGVITQTIAGGTAARATLALRFPSIPAGAVNFSFLLFSPQMEEKPYATSPIYPATDVTGATTRGAEAITIPALSSWRSTEAATLFADVTVHPGGSAFGFRVAFSLGSSTHPRHFMCFTNAGVLTNLNRNASNNEAVSEQTLLTLNAARPNVRMAMAISNAAARYAAWDGVTLSEAAATPTLGLDLASATELHVGYSPVFGPRQLNGYINNLRYTPRLLSVAEIRAMVRGF